MILCESLSELLRFVIFLNPILEKNRLHLPLGLQSEKAFLFLISLGEPPVHIQEKYRISIRNKCKIEKDGKEGKSGNRTLPFLASLAPS